MLTIIPARRVYRSVKVTKHSTIPYVRYSFQLCNLSFIRCAVFTIFHFKNVVTLKSGSEVTQGHWKWHNSTDCVWFTISVVFFSNFVPKTRRFWDIRLQKCRDLENRVSRSLDISPCDRAHMTSYSRSVATMALSYCFWDIQCRKISWPWNRGQRSLKVIENGSIR